MAKPKRNERKKTIKFPVHVDCFLALVHTYIYECVRASDFELFKNKFLCISFQSDNNENYEHFLCHFGITCDFFYLNSIYFVSTRISVMQCVDLSFKKIFFKLEFSKLKKLQKRVLSERKQRKIKEKLTNNDFLVFYYKLIHHKQ